MNDPRDMTDNDLAEADASMMAGYRASGTRSLSDDHRAVKAEMGHRAAERARKESRSRAAKKSVATRARRAAAGLSPKYRAFTLDNAPVDGWTEADRV